MSRRRFLVPSLCAVFLGLALSARAESPWKLPDLNPFDNAPDTAKSQKSSGFLSLPTWSWPGKKAEKRPAAQKPSAWSRMSTGTKQFWSKTKDVLTPWDKDEEKSGSRLGFKSQKEKESSSFLTGWLKGKDEEPRQPRTVSEWLAQPRP